MLGWGRVHAGTQVPIPYTASCCGATEHVLLLHMLCYFLQEGWNKLFMKGAETPVMPALLLAGSLAMFYLAATAGELRAVGKGGDAVTTACVKLEPDTFEGCAHATMLHAYAMSLAPLRLTQVQQTCVLTCHVPRISHAKLGPVLSCRARFLVRVWQACRGEPACACDYPGLPVPHRPGSLLDVQ